MESEKGLDLVEEVKEDLDSPRSMANQSKMTQKENISIIPKENNSGLMKENVSVLSKDKNAKIDEKNGKRDNSETKKKERSISPPKDKDKKKPNEEEKENRENLSGLLNSKNENDLKKSEIIGTNHKL